MTKMTVLHFASPFAVSALVPRPRLELANREAEADTSQAGLDGTSEPISSADSSWGADPVSLLAGDAAPSPSQAASELSLHDSVLQRYRDLDDEAPEQSATAEQEGDPEG